MPSGPTTLHVVALHLDRYRRVLSDLAFFAVHPDADPRPDGWELAMRGEVNDARSALLGELNDIDGKHLPAGHTAESVRRLAHDAAAGGLDLITRLCDDELWGTRYTRWVGEADRRAVDRVDAAAGQLRDLIPLFERRAEELLGVMVRASEPPPSPVQPPPPDEPDEPEGPDGFFGVSGFRFRGVKVDLGRAPLRVKILAALWDQARGRPRPAMERRAVIREAWGERDAADVSDNTFSSSLAEIRKIFQKVDLPLRIDNENDRVELVPR